MREGLKIFPNNWDLLESLAVYLHFQSDDGEQDKRRKEAVKIYERIIEFCPDPFIRNKAQVNLCYVLNRLGEKDKAIEIAFKLPHISMTRENALPDLLERGEQINLCQETITNLAHYFWRNVRILTQSWNHPDMPATEHYSANEALKLLDKAIAVYELVYDGGDYNFAHEEAWSMHADKAQIYAKLGKADEAVAALERAKAHAIAYDTLPASAPHTSLLVNTLEYKKLATSKNSETNSCQDLKYAIENFMLSILTDERVRAISAELDKYAEGGV